MFGPALVNLSSTHLALLSSFAIILILSLTRRRKGRLLPPSPPSDPVIGHAKSIPLHYAWKTFAAWRKIYGDIIYIHVLGSPMIILNSASVARDLLDKRSANFSDRPRMHVLGGLMGWSLSLPFLAYGNRFRWQRKLIQRYFDAQAVTLFRPIQTERVEAFINELLHNPADFHEATQRLIASTILKATYGYSVLPDNDPIFTLLERAATMSGEAGTPGGTIIDLFPVLRFVPVWFPSWFPGVTLKRHSLRTRELVEEIMSRTLRELKEKKAAGLAEPCFVSKMLDDYEVELREDPGIEEDIRVLGSVTYTAGFETSSGSILTFLMMMTLHPEITEKAQAEIDGITGGERLPSFDDREHMPYIDCIMKEVFRINSITPLAIPHRALQTEKYGDWVIPKGAVVVPNIWQMMRDEQCFPNPDVFSPERHLDKVKGSSEASAKHERNDDPSNLVFGFGRRICPGRFFAENTVWLTIACILAVFDVRPYVDKKSGKEVLPEFAFLSGVTSQPKPFKCAISPRSEKHASLIRQNVYV